MMNKQFTTLLVGALALAFVPGGAQAGPIRGGISFDGNVTPFISAIGNGGVTGDYTQAHSLVFGPSRVSVGPNGSFAVVPPGDPITMYSPLVINQPVVPNGALWTVGKFSFRATSISAPLISQYYLALDCEGVFSDGTPADSAPGTWLATFTSSGSTFGWICSSSAVPEPGVISLAALSCVRQGECCCIKECL